MTHEELLTHIIHWRRDLHAIPEMGNSEWETSAYIERAVGETRPDSACTLAGTGRSSSTAAAGPARRRWPSARTWTACR